MLILYLDLKPKFPMRCKITPSWISEIMTFLLLMRNTSRKTRADTWRCPTIVFTTSTSLQVLPTQYGSLLNSHLFQKSQVVPWMIRHYNQSELHTIHQVLLNMIRVKAKRDLVGILNYADSIFSQCLFCSILQCFLLQKIDMLGTRQVVNIIKELWTEFDEPIAFVCKEANLGQHLEGILKATKAIVKVCSFFSIPLFILPFYFIPW